MIQLFIPFICIAECDIYSAFGVVYNLGDGKEIDGSA
jgi:hypothetical protein